MGQCYNSTVINAPVDKVWAALKNFHDMPWSKVMESVEKVGDKGPNEVGAKRLLNGAFAETLVAFDEAERSFRYSIDGGPAPLTADAIESYFGSVNVYPVTDSGKTFVLWTSEYKTKDDSAVHEMCDPLYQTLLRELGESFG